MLRAVPIALNPATPPPMTKIFAGGDFPAAVIWPRKAKKWSKLGLMRKFQLTCKESSKTICCFDNGLVSSNVSHWTQCIKDLLKNVKHQLTKHRLIILVHEIYEEHNLNRIDSFHFFYDAVLIKEIQYPLQRRSLFSVPEDQQSVCFGQDRWTKSVLICHENFEYPEKMNRMLSDWYRLFDGEKRTSSLGCRTFKTMFEA